MSLALAVGAVFSPLDWGVVALYLALLITTGVVLARRKPKNTKDYFLAERSMPAWAVAVSLLATIQSAATFVGVPEQGFRGDLRYVSTSIGALLAAVILFAFFLPAYYRIGASTPYQLLRDRFGPTAAAGASWTYLLGRVLASGARIYIGAVPFAIAVLGSESPAAMNASIAGFVAFGIVYTLAGGVRSVIWTDVVQVGVYLGAAAAIVGVLLAKIPADLGTIWNALAHPPEGGSKLTMLRVGLDPTAPGLGFDPTDQFTLLTAVTGFMLLNVAALGTDQDLVQRSLTCRSPVRAGWSVLAGTLIGIPAVLLFSAIGLLLYVYYRRPDLMGAAGGAGGEPGSTRLLVDFSLREMPAGMGGLMIAGMLAAGPAGINSSLNAMSSSFVEDFYKPLRPGRSERHYLLVGRLGVVGWGIVLGLFACVCVAWRRAAGQTLIDLALSVMTFAYAGLLGAFLAAMFTRRGTVASVLAALVSGFTAVVLMQPFAWDWWTGWAPGLGDLRGTRIAYPWQLVIGTAIAFAVACIPRGRGVKGP